MLKAQRPSHLRELHAMRRRLVVVRRAPVPQRDLLGRFASGREPLPGLTPADERYFRDVSDHLVRLTEQIDGFRDLIAGSMDLYESTAAHRLNEVVKQLTLLATIFLPLTFITGFFGQNFPWLVDHVGGWPAFVGLGIGLDLVAVALLLAFFRRRGWF